MLEEREARSERAELVVCVCVCVLGMMCARWSGAGGGPCVMCVEEKEGEVEEDVVLSVLRRVRC